MIFGDRIEFTQPVAPVPGTIISVFMTLGGKIRYVAELDNGHLLITELKYLRLLVDKADKQITEWLDTQPPSQSGI